MPRQKQVNGVSCLSLVAFSSYLNQQAGLMELPWFCFLLLTHANARWLAVGAETGTVIGLAVLAVDTL